MKLDYSELAEASQERMILGEQMAWSDWWCEVVELPIPKKGTLSYEKNYKQRRHRIVIKINDEFVARKLSNRLVCVPNRGVTLWNGNGSTNVTAIARIKKITSSHTNMVAQLEALADSDDKFLVDKDKKLLSNLAAHAQSHLSTFAGTIGRMKSLPVDVKKQLLLEMGIEL